MNPRHARRRSALVVAIALFGLSATASFHIPLLPEITRRLGLDVGDVGVFATVFALGRLIADLPAGRLIDARGPGVSLLVGGHALGLGAGFVAVASGRSGLLVAAAVLGAGSALANTSGMAYFSTISARRRAMAMSVYASGLLGGQAIGPVVGGFINDAHGWRVAMGVAPVLVAAIIAMLLLIGPVQASARSESARVAGELDSGTLSRRSLWILRFVTFAVAFGLIGIGQTMVPIIGDVEHGMSAATIGTVLGVAGIARLFGALVAGAVADRVSRKRALVPGLFLQAAGVSLIRLLPTPAGWVTATIAMSAASYGVIVGATMLGDGVAHRELGRELGRYRLVGDLGFVAGPATAAHFLSRAQGEHTLVVATILLVTSAVLVATGVPETRPTSVAANPLTY